MKVQSFSVFDGAANMFLEPFFAPTLEVAIRGFREAVTREGHQFNKFPQDYTLFHVGEFDQERGEYTPLVPHSLGVAITFLQKPLEVKHG